MKHRKDGILIHNILLLLSENEYISVSKIASILETSDSTIRRKVEILNDAIKDSGYGCIQKLPRKGLHLVVENSQAIEKLFSSFSSGSITTKEQQIDQYLFLLLSSKSNRTTLKELSELVYDSVPVVRKNLRKCDEWLKVFDLHVEIKKNFGVSLKGSEENIRLAIKHLILNNARYSIDESIGFFAKGLNLSLLKQCIFTMKEKWNLKLAEESFHSMLIYASLAIIRSKYTKLNVSAEDKDTITRYDEYNWSKSLFQMIDETFSTKISEDEIIYFSVQLLCSYLIHSDDSEEHHAYKYDETLKGFVTHIIAVISEVLNVDLTRDSELYYGLLSHIRPAIFRMRFEKKTTKALSKYIKEEYKQMYRVSWTLSILFEEYYGINISSTELSYIALYFQASLERMSNPVSMAFVTEMGMGVNQLAVNKIKISIPRVERIVIISLHDFKQSMVGEYDLIVTTSDLGVESDKIMQSGSLLTEHDIIEIKHRIDWLSNKRLETKTRFHRSCHDLFDPRLIFTNLQVKDKEELLNLLSGQLAALGYVTAEYHDSILKREKTVSTYIGNGVAIPHGNSGLANASKVAIAILDREIMWDEENSVNIVFLLAFKISSKEESGWIQLFYKGFLEMIETDSNLQYLRELQGEELYNYLIQ